MNSKEVSGFGFDLSFFVLILKMWCLHSVDVIDRLLSLFLISRVYIFLLLLCFFSSVFCAVTFHTSLPSLFKIAGLVFCFAHILLS